MEYLKRIFKPWQLPSELIKGYTLLVQSVGNSCVIQQQ